MIEDGICERASQAIEYVLNMAASMLSTAYSAYGAYKLYVHAPLLPALP